MEESSAVRRWRFRVQYLAFFGGIFLIVIGMLLLWRGMQSASWTPTPAVVRSTHIAQPQEETQEFYPVVTYAYTMNGQNFVSTRLSFGGGYTSKERRKVEEFLTHYPVGGTVTAYVDPDWPQSSVLLASSTTGPLTMFVLGGLLILFAGFVKLALRGYRQSL